MYSRHTVLHVFILKIIAVCWFTW